MVWPTLDSRTAKEQNRTERICLCCEWRRVLFQRDAVHLLQLLNLSDYADCLARQGYTSLQAILDLNWEDLEEIGISKLGIGKDIYHIYSMHHYECVAMCKDTSLQRGRFCARSLASWIPRSSEGRSSWTFFIQVVRGRFDGRLQVPGGGSKMAWLASAFSSIRARCPKKVRRRDLMVDDSGGWLVIRRMSAFLTKSCQRMSRILRRHHIKIYTHAVNRPKKFRPNFLHFIFDVDLISRPTGCFCPLRFVHSTETELTSNDLQ